MPTTYEEAPMEVVNLIAEIKTSTHGRLIENDVKIGVLMATAHINEQTGRKGVAIRGYGGAAASACVKVVSLKDRLIKKYDVEMLIDKDQWDFLPETSRRALIDHELTHIDLAYKVDDLGRPVIKMRKEDFIVWGFLEVAKRHGSNALEARSVRALIEEHGQLLLGFTDGKKIHEVEVANYVEKGDEEAGDEEGGKPKRKKRNKKKAADPAENASKN